MKHHTNIDVILESLLVGENDFPNKILFCRSTKEDNLTSGLTTFQDGFDSHGSSNTRDTNQVMATTMSEAICKKE